MVKQADKNPESPKKVSTENQDNLNTGISKENSKKVAEALNEVLADEFVPVHKNTKLPLEYRRPGFSCLTFIPG